MYMATGKAPNGREIVVIGLSFDNLDRLRDAPCDTFVHVEGPSVGVAFDIMIFSGETEAHCADMLRDIGPGTEVPVTGRKAD